MKKAIRIILPIILAVSIIACLAWYLLVYDQTFTRDMLLYTARHFENRGKHETASEIYDLAYRQTADNDGVAIELAEQHKAIGNYTKAESVLNQAIADGGSAELYIALCKTYVEQDKLLDAAKLLDAVCRKDSTVDSSIRDAITSLRPAAPVPSPAPGFYNQYISVTITSNNGLLYVNTNGEYPSVLTDAYDAPITLQAGENTIYAITVSENGLVSPISILGYTVGGVIEEVIFTDSAIEQAVRTILGKSEIDVLFTNDLWEITEFSIPEGATDYTDIKHMQYLESLTISSGVAGQLNNISSLSQLATLNITNTPVDTDELKIIGVLPKLQKLTLSGCGLSTVAGLENATGLINLDLSKNTVRNIAPLSSMKDLQELNLQHNALTDLSALSSCTSLTSLNISNNSVVTLAPVCGITSITKLNADHNVITQLGNVGQITALTELTVSYNQLTEISQLANSTSIKTLDISNNQLADISLLADLPALTHLNFSYNQIATLPVFASDCALIEINGSHNLLTSLENLGGLKNINTVYMDYNTEITSVKALTECPVLILVSVYGTKVTEITMLTDQSVIVHYNPTTA